MNTALRRLLLFVLLVYTGRVQAETVRLVDVRWPRDYGYEVGDLIAIRARLEVPPGWVLDRDGLPEVGKSGAGFEVHRRALNPAASEDCPQCQLLVIEWQLFRSVREPVMLKLPQTHVRFRKDGHVADIVLPAFTLSASPLQDWLSQRDWVGTAQPSIEATRYTLAPPLRRAAFAVSVSILLGVAWAWVTGRIGARRQRPFASACQALRRLAPNTAVHEALLLMHRGFNDSAGYAVFAGNLGRYFAEHPEFSDVSDSAHALFGASRGLFFDDQAAPPPLGDIAKLMHALRDRERLL